MLKAILAKLHTRSIALSIGAALIGAGIFMCVNELGATGSIDIKSPFVSGTLQTGSLGLLVIFLGVIVVLAIVRSPGVTERRPERIELVFGDVRVICENISYRKVQEIRALLERNDPRSAVIAPNNGVQPTPVSGRG